MFAMFECSDYEQKFENLKKLISSSEKQIEDLLKIENPTYQNFMKPYQNIHEKVELFFKPISILQYTKNSPEIQKVYSDSLPILTEFGTNTRQDLRLYKTYKMILENEKNSLNIEQKKVLEDGILDFELDGANLDEEKKKQIKEINIKLSDLANNFSQNLLDANKAFELFTEDFEDVKELPSQDLELAKEEIDGKIKYKFTLLPPSMNSYLTYGTNRAIREEIYKAYTTRAPQNGKIIEEILDLKTKKAKLLGLENYVELSLKPKMAKDYQNVIDFLEDLLKHSLTQAKKELEDLKNYAKKLGFTQELTSFDTGYYSKKQELEKYQLDDEKYRPYFERNSVVNGLLEFLSKIFLITFKKVEVEVWDKSVVAYDILENNKIFARIYMDLESRQTKRGGAWMDSWQSHQIDENGKEILSQAYICCNFPPEKETIPSLLTHSDVVTLFHEMGHAIHHLFSKVNEAFVSGIAGVEWDAVEFPSQWLESFAYDKDVLKIFAKHHKTKEIISDDMIDNIIRSKNYNSALAMVRQVEFALFDIKTHLKAHTQEEVQIILDDVRKKTSLIKPPAYNKFQNGFSHIFGGGYAAGYYSYKWAEVLSADAFYRFIEMGIFNLENSLSFKKEILEKGGSKSAKILFNNFMKRDPDPKSLLKLNGII